jgi:hypothetical protein
MSPTQLIDQILANVWLWFTILVFTCYSITRLVVTDDFFIFAKPREWLKYNFPPEDYIYNGEKPKHRKPNQYKRLPNNRDYIVLEGHFIGELISCPWCFSFWAACVLWGGFLLAPVAVIALSVPLAVRVLVGSVAQRNGG